MFLPFGKQGLEFYMFLLAQGGSDTPVAGEEFSHWEEDAYTKYITAGATVAAPGAGTSFTLTVSADDVSSDGYCYLRVDNVIENLNNGAQYLITAKLSSTTFTADPILSTTNFAVTTGDVFQVLGTAYAENTGQPETAFAFQTKYDFNMQIYKDTASISGTEKTQELWVTSDTTGTSFTGYWNRMLMQAEYRMIQQEYNLQFWSTPGDNAGAQTMNGLVYEMDEDGANRAFNLAVTGSLGLADLEDIANQMQAEYYYGPCYGWLSKTRYSEINSALTTEFADVNIARVNREVQNYFWDGIEGSVRDTLAGTMDYKSVVTAGRTFSFQLGFAFNDPASGRLNNNRSQKLSMFLPIGSSTSPTGFTQNYLRTRYKALGDYSRRREVWRDGTAHNGLRIGEMDFSAMYFRSHTGLQSFMLNRSTYISGTVS
jgi:hypothetical protein